MGELGSILAGAGAFISAIVVLLNVISKRKKQATEDIQKDIGNMKEDISVIKEAVYYALAGVVELGANGDSKLAKERLKDIIFKE